MKQKVTILILIDGFLQWSLPTTSPTSRNSHNPYFNRWFSAIDYAFMFEKDMDEVTILILIDGFLQYLLILI